MSDEKLALTVTPILQRIENEVAKLTTADAAGFVQVQKNLQLLSSGVGTAVARLDALSDRLTALEAAIQTIGQTTVEILALLNQPASPEGEAVGISVKPGAPTTRPPA